MSYFYKNMKAIESSKSYLSKKLKEYTEGNTSEGADCFELLETRDGDTALMLSGNGKSIRLNSLYSPIHEAQRWVRQYEMKNLGIVVSMFGIGNGIFVRELLKQLGDRGVLFVYEPSPSLFYFVMENYDISDIISAGNVSITIEGVNDNEIKNLLSGYIDWINLRSQIACIHPGYDEFFDEGLKTFHKIINDNINRTIVNKNTDVVNCKVITDNILRNFKLLRDCNVVTDLQGAFPREVPAIIVAAGPSLDKNIEDLKLAKGKSVIFAVDTAMKYLLAHGIEPDFIVTLDPRKALHHLSNPICRNIPVFCRIDSRPENLASNQKRIILYNVEGYIKSIYMRLGIETGEIRSGGSVATGAFSLCETMGFQRIILIGQDLAYAGNATHAGGVIVDASGAGENARIVEDIYGNPIKTRYDWYIYIRWFEDAVELFDGEEVIDATEGGAKIKGTTIMTLKEAIDKYCSTKVDCSGILKRLEPTLVPDLLRQARKDVQEDLRDLSEMKPKLEEAIALCDRLLEKYSNSPNETNSSQMKNQRIREINRELEDKAIYQLLDWDISKETSEQISDLYLYTEDEAKDRLATYQHAKTIYQALLGAIDRIRPIMENAYREFAADEA